MTQGVKIQAVTAILLFWGASAGAMLKQGDFGFETIQAPPSCQDSLHFYEPGRIRSDFPHNDHYTSRTVCSEVRNQYGIGTCWLESAISYAEHLALRRGQVIRLSSAALVAQALHNHAFQALSSESPLAEGGNYSEAELLIRYHSIPESAWRPRRPLSIILPPLIALINLRIARFKEERHFWAGNLYSKEYSEAAEDIRELFDAYFGKIPRTFTYEGRQMDSHEFADAYIPEFEKPVLYRPILRNRHGRRRDNPDPQVSTAKQAEIDTILDKIRRQIEGGQAVVMSLSIQWNFVDSHRGVMSIGAFPLPANFKLPSRAYLKKNPLRPSLHQVEVVGVDVDPVTHKVIKLLIKNTWGVDIGDNGYCHLYPDYLAAFLDEVYIYE